jgi:hypothetical protein
MRKTDSQTGEVVEGQRRQMGEYQSPNEAVISGRETGLMAIVQCVHTPRTTIEKEEAESWDAEIELWGR